MSIGELTAFGRTHPVPTSSGVALRIGLMRRRLGSPLGTWTVTSFHGRHASDRGVWRGHIVDIAAHLGGWTDGGLLFEPAARATGLLVPAGPPTAARVTVSVGRPPDLGALNPFDRAQVMQGYLGSEASRQAYALARDANGGAGVQLVFATARR